jgi:regulatory protein YycH of two-component signal transduction system YycFG
MSITNALNMKSQDYRSTIVANVTPKEAFDAITNVRDWFSQATEGETDRLGAVFYYHYQDNHRCTFKITEFVPGKKIVWHVLQNYFKFVKDTTEWTGTDVVFEIERKGDKTEVQFIHVGLVPTYECYDVCSKSWEIITQSLRELITTGKGKPLTLEESE